jgi:hypothetical protein
VLAVDHHRNHLGHDEAQREAKLIAALREEPRPGDDWRIHRGVTVVVLQQPQSRRRGAVRHEGRSDPVVNQATGHVDVPAPRPRTKPLDDEATVAHFAGAPIAVGGGE